MPDGSVMLRPERFLPALSQLSPQALVMDACSLTGAALCDLAAGVMQAPQGRHLTTLSGLAAGVAHLPLQRTLVITELFSAREGISAGLATLAWLARYRAVGLRVMVCTAVTDPLLLRLALALRPSVITLRRERLAVLEAAMYDSAERLPRTRLSPGAAALLTQCRQVNLTPRENEWLLTQADGLGLQASAERMQVAYKTAAAVRNRVIHRLGDNAITFAQRMAALRAQTGFALSP